MKMRIEKDSMGELEVPENALYGAQTQGAINNFPTILCNIFLWMFSKPDLAPART